MLLQYWDGALLSAVFMVLGGFFLLSFVWTMLLRFLDRWGNPDFNAIEEVEAALYRMARRRQIFSSSTTFEATQRMMSPRILQTIFVLALLYMIFETQINQLNPQYWCTPVTSCVNGECTMSQPSLAQCLGDQIGLFFD